MSQTTVDVAVFAPAMCNDAVAMTLALKHTFEGSSPSIVTSIHGENETELFDGLYPNLRRFYDTVLDNLRLKVVENAEKVGSAWVYIGADVGSLYAAYYLAVRGIEFGVTLVEPQALGGYSPWARQHPLLLNKLLTTILSNACVVEICGQEHFENLPRAFPRIQREYVLADTALTEEEEKRLLRSYPKRLARA